MTRCWSQAVCIPLPLASRSSFLREDVYFRRASADHVSDVRLLQLRVLPAAAVLGREGSCQARMGDGDLVAWTTALSQPQTPGGGRDASCQLWRLLMPFAFTKEMGEISLKAGFSLFPQRGSHQLVVEKQKGRTQLPTRPLKGALPALCRETCRDAGSRLTAPDAASKNGFLILPLKGLKVGFSPHSYQESHCGESAVGLLAQVCPRPGQPYGRQLCS